jgi:hypothetical protein
MPCEEILQGLNENGKIPPPLKSVFILIKHTKVYGQFVRQCYHLKKKQASPLAFFVSKMKQKKIILAFIEGVTKGLKHTAQVSPSHSLLPNQDGYQLMLRMLLWRMLQ